MNQFFSGNHLTVGESLLVPRPAPRRPYSDFYAMAKNGGVKISIRSTGKAMLKLIPVD
jgi:hypothetical protein